MFLILRWKQIVLVLIFFVLGLGTGLFWPGGDKSGYIPALRLSGDVEKPLQVKELTKNNLLNIEYRDSSYRVIRLKELVERAIPRSNNYELVLIGEDGLTACLAGTQLEESYIYYSTSSGWSALNLNHPISSNIKQLEQIIIVSLEPLPDRTLSFISPNENIRQISPGQLLKGALTVYPYFEGASTFKVEGVSYRTGIYTRRRLVKPGELVEREIKRSLIIGAKGEEILDQGGFLELGDNQVNYFNPASGKGLKNVRGIILDAPVARNSDAFHDALYYLEQDQRVLIIMLDGFGFHQYKYALENGYAPFLVGTKRANRVLSVFQPVTNAGLAAVLTGTGPENNGVYSRKQKELQSDDIFQKAEEMGKRSAYIEGHIKILNTTVEPVLNPDVNQNGTTDDEIMAAGLAAIAEDYALLFVHFHGIDDQGHHSGDLSSKTMEIVRVTDAYLQELVAVWPGQVIITADHGMHQTTSGGSHGIVCYQDLFVPYLIIEGGKQG